MVLPEHYVRRNPFLAVPPPHKDNQGPGGAAKVYPISTQVTTAAEHEVDSVEETWLSEYVGSEMVQLRRQAQSLEQRPLGLGTSSRLHTIGTSV